MRRGLWVVLLVEFDETYHHPRSIEIDYSRNVADDEIGHGVTGFKVLSPSG